MTQEHFFFKYDVNTEHFDYENNNNNINFVK